MAKIFNTGDVVHLVSGGPDMTVERVGYEPLGPTAVPAPRVHCVWFSSTEAFAFGNFSPDVLVNKSPAPVKAPAVASAT